MALSLVANKSTPEDEQQLMLQQLNQAKAKQGQPQVQLPQQQGPLSQFSEMAQQKIMGDALGAGTEALYSKGAEMFASKAAPQLAASLPAGVAPAGYMGAGTAATAAGAPALTGAATGAATTGAMAGLGAAVPYIGAGLLAGKAFGLFNKGGKVDLMKDPLAEYKAEGGDIPTPANLREEMNKKARDYASFNYGIMDDGSFEGKKAARKETIKDLKTNHPKAIKRLMSEYKEEGGLIGPLALRKIKYKQDGGKVELELSGE